MIQEAHGRAWGRMPVHEGAWLRVHGVVCMGLMAMQGGNAEAILSHAWWEGPKEAHVCSDWSQGPAAGPDSSGPLGRRSCSDWGSARTYLVPSGRRPGGEMA